MSKLVNQYKELKQKDEDKIYLFKSGIFYIALDKDAENLSNKIGFKLTPLNEQVKKCGFPVNRIDYYKKIFEIGNINYELISDNAFSVNTENLPQDKKIIEFLNKLTNIDFNNITYKQAFEILEDISSKAKQIIL